MMKNCNATIKEHIETILLQSPVWFKDKLTDNARATESITAMVKLLFFTDVIVASSDQTIAQLVHTRLPTKCTISQGDLSEEFSAKALERVAGYEFHWTSNLEDHLEMSGGVIKFFRHAAILEHLDNSYM
jgi:hypothetical protein